MPLARVTSGNNGSFNAGYSTGNLLVILAYNNASNTVPSTPTGYTSLTSAQQSADGSAMAVFYKVATSGSETYPTITNSTQSVYAIYSGQSGTPFSGTGGQASSGSSSTISYSGIVSFGSSNDWVLTFGVGHANTGNIGTHPPTSMTLPTNGETKGTGFDVAIFDSNGTLSSYSFNSKTLDASIVWMTKTTELVAAAAGVTNHFLTLMGAGT